MRLPRRLIDIGGRVTVRHGLQGNVAVRPIAHVLGLGPVAGDVIQAVQRVVGERLGQVGRRARLVPVLTALQNVMRGLIAELIQVPTISPTVWAYK